MKMNLMPIPLVPKEVEPKLIDSIKSTGYAVVENCVNQNLLAAARHEYELCMSREVLHAQGEKFSPAELERAPWRKQAIGSRSGSGEHYSQLLQTTYLRPRSADYPALSSIFLGMISLRNSLTGMHLEYGNNLSQDAFWNACRVHHYPQGGGHMAAHRDTLFPQLLRDFDIPFIQVMLTLSARGTDFNVGGGYVTNRSGQKVFFETANSAGSLILFDGSTVHGVDDVDPDTLLDFSSRRGRIALFVNLYKNHNAAGV